MGRSPSVSDSEEFEKKRHFKAYTVLICTCMSLGSMAMGMAASVISITLGQPSFIRKMGLDGPHATALEGAMNSLFYAGGVAGSICSAWAINSYGPKMSILMGTVILLISQALLTGSVNAAMFIVFRFFSGWGSFQNVCGVPLWISETVPPRNRGMLADIHSIFINVGYTIIGYVGVGFYFYQSENAWRGAIGITMVPSVVLLSGIYWLPESPRYLIAKDRKEEAWATIHRLHSDPNDPTDEFAKREFYQIYRQIQFDQSLKTGYWEILKRPSYRKRAFMSMMLAFCIMSSGLITIQNYGVSLYAALGYVGLDSLLFQTGYTACALLTSVIAMTYVDRVKRNRLMAAGFTGCTIALIIYTALVKNLLGTDNKSGQAVAVAMLFFFVSSFELCLDGPEFFYQAEIWPSHLRAQGFTIFMVVYNGINICWLQAAPTAFQNIGWHYYIFFIIFAALGAVSTLLFFPDTLHKPLEEVAAMFGDNDLVVVYQKDLDNSSVPLATIEMVIPGYGAVREAGLDKDALTIEVENGGIFNGS